MSRMIPKAAALASLLAAALAGPSARAEHQNLTLPTPLPGAGVGAFPVPHGPIGQPTAPAAPQYPGGYPVTGVPFPAPTAPAHVGGCAPVASPVIGAVDTLIAQVGAFLQVFGPTAHCVPEGDCIQRDATALYQSALAFRQAAQAGAPPQVLAGLYGEMDAACCRLVTRVNRIARGRTGPNIEQVRLIGALCNQIRALI